MKLNKLVTAVLIALTLMLTAPARAVEVPKEAIGEATALVVWVDLEQVDNDIINKVGEGLASVMDNPLLQQQAGGLPLGALDDMLDSMTNFRDGFVKAGGEGLVLTMELPGEGSWSPPISLLAKTKENVDAKAMGDLIREMSEGDMNAELAPVVEGWHDLSIVKSGNGEEVTQALPSKPDKKAYKAFDDQLGEVKKPVLSVAFRMQDQLRERIQQMAQGANQGQQQDPQAAMMAGMVGLLQGLDTVGFAISSDDEEIEVDIQMVFLKAGDAQQFGQMYNSIMMLAPALLAAQIQDIENAPDPNTINKFFMKLQMKQNGDTLKLNLDQEFFDLVEEMGPLFEGLGGQVRPNA